MKGIKKGTLIWKSIPGLSVEVFDYQQVLKKMASLKTEKDKKLFLTHSYLWGGKFFHPIDKSRFWNHSSSPNTGPCPINGEDTIALRDIPAGEELFDDYGLYGASKWYDNLYAKYGVLTPQQVAAIY